MGVDESLDEDGTDEDVFYESVFITGTLVQASQVFFTSTEVLWDSQAGQPIFSNRSLLENVGPHSTPYRLHGIHRDAPGLEVVECETLGGFDGVGYSPHSANVLSMPAAVDAGIPVRYDHTLDAYDVGFPTGTVRFTPVRVERLLASRVTQMEQRLLLDVMHVASTPFLLGLLEPLGLYLVAYLPDVSAATIAPRIRGFISKATSRNFVRVQCRSDNDGGIAAMREELQSQGVDVQPCGPEQHVPEIERAIRVVKERDRCHIHGMPFRLNSMFLMMLVCFCVGRINWQRRNGVDIAPAEQFLGRKLDANVTIT